MKKKIGLALGSGAARGISHFGIIKALKREKIEPDIVCGSSMGALVGAALVTGHLEELEQWFKEQSTTTILRHLDFNLFASGGIADGELFINYLKETFGDYKIEELSTPYAAVACDMHSGKEIWLTKGSIWEAVRASGAYPGLLTPVKRDGRWLVDGGIVNPVPVSVCRALGATHVIGVNLNRDLITLNTARTTKERNGLLNLDNTAIGKLGGKIVQAVNQRFNLSGKSKEPTPGIMDVISCTINIMQDRITRSRLAGDPADVMFNPRLSHIGFLETDKAREIIAEGEECVERHRDQLNYLH